MILVTGAAGFIGSNILACLEEAGLGPIAVCDWFESDTKWLNVAKREIAEFISPENLLISLRRRQDVKAIIHMGAISATTERNVDLLIERNIQTTVNLWDYCAEANIPFIYASSAATYGALEHGLIDDESPEALAKLRPLNAYGWSKKATDQILISRLAQKKKVPPQWVGLKFFNVYGPNEYHKGSMMSVVAKFFDPVRAGAPVRLFKSDRDDIEHGEQKRDFIYVKDCSNAIVWLIQNPQVSGIFNLGTGKARSFRDVVCAIGLAMNKSVNIEYVDMPAELTGKYQYFTQSEMEKFRLHGLPSDFHSVELGVRDYVLNYLCKKDPYR